MNGKCKGKGVVRIPNIEFDNEGLNMLVLNRFMNRNILLMIFFLSALTAVTYAEVIEGIAAVVNDRVLTLTDLEEEFAIRKQLGDSVDKAAVIDSLIEREVVSDEAGRLGLTAAMDEVSREIIRFEGTFPSKEEFNRFLSAYELDLQELSRRFASYIATSKVRQQKEAISPGRYEKWLEEAKKKGDIRIVE